MEAIVTFEPLHALETTFSISLSFPSCSKSVSSSENEILHFKFPTGKSFGKMILKVALTPLLVIGNLIFLPFSSYLISKPQVSPELRHNKATRDALFINS